MTYCTITGEMLVSLEKYLREEEKCEATIEKYIRDSRQFAMWLADGELTKEAVLGWKNHLLENGDSARTVNGKICSLNAFLRHINRDDCRVKLIKVQRRAFRDKNRDLSRSEYQRLVKTARSGKNTRLQLIIETICSTGIRVSEVKYITVEAARCGRTEISLKGKVRIIMLPKKLCDKLLKYADIRGITSGTVFVTGNGVPISRRQIWGEMKKLCEKAGVDAKKVFPHNLRHLFAVEYYRINHDIVKLADVLGHASIETTRIYLITDGTEHQKQIDSMRLVS